LLKCQPASKSCLDWKFVYLRPWEAMASKWKTFWLSVCSGKRRLGVHVAAIARFPRDVPSFLQKGESLSRRTLMKCRHHAACCYSMKDSKGEQPGSSNALLSTNQEKPVDLSLRHLTHSRYSSLMISMLIRELRRLPVDCLHLFQECDTWVAENIASYQFDDANWRQRVRVVHACASWLRYPSGVLSTGPT
jgi:hypothetical protein